MNENPLSLTAALAGVATAHLGEPGGRSRFPSVRSDTADTAGDGARESTDDEDTSAQDVWRKILFSASPTIS